MGFQFLKNFLFGKMGNHLVLEYIWLFIYFLLQAFKNIWTARSSLQKWLSWRILSPLIFFIKTTSITWIIRYASKQYSFIMWSSPKDTIKEQSSLSAAPWKHLWSFKKASHARSTLPLDPLGLVNWSGAVPRHWGLSKLPRGADAQQQWESLLKQNFSNFSAEKWVSFRK